MKRLGTAQQLAAFIVNNTGSYAPTPHFELRQIGAAWQLVARYDDDEITMCSTRNVAMPRDFKTIEAALNAAQLVSSMAGLEADHAWTGSPSRLGAMPEVRIVICNAIQA